MGTSRSTAELVGKINKAAAGIATANRRTVQTAAQAGKDLMIAGAAAGGLTPGRPFPRETRTGKPGGRSWGVNYRVTGGLTPSAYLAYRGPVHLVEGPTRAHLIAARRKGRFAMKLGESGPVRRAVSHPGTKGRPFWQPTKRRVIAATTTIARAQHSRNLMETFR